MSTGTLSYSDIDNKAEYQASSKGVNANISKTANANEKGITPAIGIGANGNAQSTTKAAIAPGTIEVRDNPNQDLSNLSRDTKGSLNQLGKIFDKKSIQERQELAKMFGELAYEEVHKLSAKELTKAENALEAEKSNPQKDDKKIKELQAQVAAWSEGGSNKIALHSIVGGLMADLGGSNSLAGAVGAGLNEAVQGQLKKTFKNKPDLHQWASAIIGATAAKVVGGNAQTGASTAASGTKNNQLNIYEIEEFKKELITALANDASAEAIQDIIRRYRELAYEERKPLDAIKNKFGETREFNEEFKEFLKDQFGFYWDEAFSTIKSYKKDATEDDVWENFYGHVKTNIEAIVWRANQNKQDLIAESGPVKGDTLLSLGKAVSINWDKNGIATSVNDEDGKSHELESPLSRGDYEYQKNGVEPFADPKTNRWFISTPDGDYPVYGLGNVGDYYADKGYPVVLGADGAHYAVTSEGYHVYTDRALTSNPIIPGGETYEEIKDNAEKEKIEVIEGALNKVDTAIKSGYNNVVKSTTDAIDLLKTRKVDFARGVVVGIDENLGFSIGQGIYFECTERRIDGSETKTYLIGKITGEGIATIVGAAEVAHGIAETIYGSEEIINGAVHLNPSTVELGSSISATGAVRSIVAGKIVKDSIENISKDVNKLNASTGNKIESGLGVDKEPSKAVTNGSYKSLPDNAKDAYGKYNKDGWNGRVPGQTEGTKAGGTYKNRDGKLPTTDQSGNPITYREYDVNNKVAGQTRDAERFVRGSDGSVYYTNDHYGTFNKVN